LDFFPTFFGDMRINFGGLCAGLYEQFLDVVQVHAFFQQVGGERMPQRACSRQRVDARPLPGGIKNVPKGKKITVEQLLHHTFGIKSYTDMEAWDAMTQPYAAGSLLSTVEDLYIWTKAVNSGKVVGKDWLKKGYTPCVLPNGENTYYGYGWGIGNLLGSEVIEHTGGINGFLSALMCLPKEDVCVAMLTNCDCEPPSNLAEKLAAMAAGKEYQPTALPLPPAK
jgi:CubicO group peptidase (beta-lactamase class C family)